MKLTTQTLAETGDVDVGGRLEAASVTVESCLGDGATCARAVGEDAPVPLCEWHVAVVVEWSQRSTGVTDLLPSPCRLCGSRLGVGYPSGWLCAICEWRVGEWPDGLSEPPRVDVVYYLRNGDRIKIGTSSNPRRRIAQIWHEEVLAFEKGGRPLEQRRHRQFADDRLGTSEWFRASPEVNEHILSLGSGVHDPWQLHLLWVSEAFARTG